VLANGVPATPHGINAEGLRRRGFSNEAIMAIKRAYKTLYREGLKLDEAKALIAEAAKEAPEVGLLSEFLTAGGRGIIR
jgi:UDP-N-acetylglucosamine acyltransferase